STEELKTPNQELKNPSQKLKYSTIFSVIISLILYPLTQIAFITVVDPKHAIDSNDIAIEFGHTILGEPGRIIIAICILISSSGCVGSLIFMGSRVITYSAKTGFIPIISNSLYNWHKKFDTPVNALILQFGYCALLLLLFPVGKSFFPFFSDMSQYLEMVFFGVSASCLLVVRHYLKDTHYTDFQVHPTIVVFYILCTAFIAVASFIPTSPIHDEVLNYGSYVPFVVSWIAVLVGTGIWYLHDYRRFF
ncbi:22352_t:CDS:2, partial [Racocetra persica]